MPECILFCLYDDEARGSEPGAGVNDRPVDGQSRALTEPQREEIPLASTTAESDELLLLAFGLRSKGNDLRMQKFCHLLMGVAIFVFGVFLEQPLFL